MNWKAFFEECENNPVYTPEQRAEWRRLRFSHDAFGFAQAFVMLNGYELLAPTEVVDSLKADLKAAL